MEHPTDSEKDPSRNNNAEEAGDHDDTAPKTKQRPHLDGWNLFCMDILLIHSSSRKSSRKSIGVGWGASKMNASSGSFRLVNSYGACGSVTVGKQRYEPIIWNSFGCIKIEFPCKPGSIHRRPCFCAPYHYRLDWNIWFIGFKPHSHYLNRRESWLYHLLAKMLGGESTSIRNDDNEGDSDKTMVANSPRSKPCWLELLDYTSRELLKQRGSPSYAKVDMYRYEMAAPLWDILPRYFYWLWGNMVGADSSGATIPWWIRHYEEPLLPVVAFDFQQ